RPDPDSPQLSKAEARALARKTWREIRQNQPEILDRITSHWRNFARRPRFRTGRVLIYLPLRDEIDILATLHDRDPAAVFAPCTLADHRMEFRQFAPASGRAIPGFQNVPGPAPDAPLLELPLREGDLVVVPALAANPDGFRLGRGGGYYDRWRDRLAPAETVALLPKSLANLGFSGESHDLCFNCIITEDAHFRT
ncbi:MAG: 5-formyltetrahydrofolate cyclo-ligase, partial [Leptospirales bacterium]